MYSLFISSLLILACSGNANEEKYVSLLPAPPPQADVTFETANIASQKTSVREQKIIKESYLRFQTSNIEKTYGTIADYIKKYNGYIQNDESGKGYNEFNRRIVIRIPTENFEAFIDSIGKDVSFFDTKRISSRDVTEEFIDLEARLKTKRGLEQRYLELLSKAKNVKEILEIEKELSVIREEIEAREGRLKYLENQVSLSTITIEFYKLTAETGITVSYGTKMWNAIKSGFNGLSFFFLGILNIWPFVLIIVILGYIIKRKYFKKKVK